MRIATADQMAGIDRATIQERKMPGLLLMEHAGLSTVAVLLSRFAKLEKPRFAIVAGGGNNGGDGFVVARLLTRHGFETTVICLKQLQDYRGDARANLEAITHCPGIAIEYAPTPETLERILVPELDRADVVVDAVLGTGARGPLSSTVEAAVRMIRRSGRPVVAIDLPTGIDPNTGQLLGEAVRADCTVTFGLPKPGFFHFPGAELRGELWVADLGFPADLTDDRQLFATLLLGHELSGLVRPRTPNSHKGDHGRLLVVGGSRGMTGAAVMAARSAARIGAGLVKLGVPASVWPAVAASVPEILTYPLPETPDGNLDRSAVDPLIRHLEGVDVLLLGPGIGREASTVDLVRQLLDRTTVPMVLDADALRAVPPGIRFEGREVVLTPHTGEAAHLLSESTLFIDADRFAALDRLVGDLKAHVVLKGAFSLIGAPGERPRVNPSGNPGLAGAGSGDVLAGTLAGLVACRQARIRSGLETGPLIDTVGLAAYLHGLAADLAAELHGIDRLTAPDVISSLPRALSVLSRVGPGERLASDHIRWT